MYELSFSIIKEVVRVWRQGDKSKRWIIVIAMIVGVVGVSVLIFGDASDTRFFEMTGLALMILAFIILSGIGVYGQLTQEQENKAKLEEKEKAVIENPGMPQAAWDLARAKLENYLDRNLSQVKSIFHLSIGVMIVGFVIIIFGVVNALNGGSIGAAMLVTFAGLITNFIGASFLIIYKSVMQQANDFVSVLERINAVGMSVQILEAIDPDNKELKENTSAEIAKKLL